MSPQRTPPALTHEPLRVFVGILAIIFCLETAVMFLLPQIMPYRIHWVEALVDASFLMLVLAPMLWSWVVKPLRQLAQTRTLLLEQTIRAQEDERRRLARDLHDEIGQSLTGLLVGLRTVEEAASLEQAKERAQSLRQIAGGTHDEVRRLARGLRPSVLDDLGLAPALERLVDDVRSAHGLAIELRLPASDLPRLSADVETALYRIVQEGLNNIVRHAQARNVTVEMERTSAAVELTIADDGVGFDAGEVAALGTSFGLSSMHERAALLQGEMQVRSQRGHGTTIRVRLPVRER
jgi:signal transduction histidine kinase